MDLVYQLNLPPAKDIFIESFKGFNDDDKIMNYQFRMDLNNILKSEWTTFKNLSWDHLLYFKKLNTEGRIHTDIGLNTKPNDTPWGITWVFEGDGLLEYWNLENVSESEMSTGSDNNNTKGVVRIYTPLATADKSYKLLCDKCYLVNGRYPHKATGFSGRKVISLRSSHIFHLPWEDIVNMFEDIII